MSPSPTLERIQDDQAPTAPRETQFSESKSCDRKKRPKKRRQSPVTASRGTRPSQTTRVFSRLRHERDKPTRRRSLVSATVFTKLGLGDKNVFTRLRDRKRGVHSWLGPEDAPRHRRVSRKRSTSRSAKTPSQRRKDDRELIRSYVTCFGKCHQEIKEEWNAADRASRRPYTQTEELNYSEYDHDQGRQWKSKKRRSNDEDDLSQPWLCEETDPFMARIRNFEVPKRTRMPINVKTYDGTGDPNDHLKIFQAAEKIERELLATKEIHKGPRRNPPYQAEGRRVDGSFHGKIQGGKSPSPYNGIIGRSGLREIQAVPSTAHGMLKFPVEGGIATIRSSTVMPAECMIITEVQDTSLPKEPMAAGGIKVAIHQKYSKQSITIGEILSEKGRMELCNLLKENLDIFAWKSADKTGIPRSIAEHRLNVRKGCQPIRQKRRGHAPDRNKEIQEEVGKLVEAEIIREVHYHDWLSNPVMVKKHDGSWRICIDFTDLNKSCLKDCYPLPEIDPKVESLCGFLFKCFFDAYKGYHQIQMAEEEKKTAFHTNQGVFYYTKCRPASKTLKQHTSDSSIPRSRRQHVRNPSLHREDGSGNEATITPNTEKSSKPKREASEFKQIREKGIPEHEKMHSRTANGNRTKTQRGVDYVSVCSQGSSKCSPTSGKGLAANTNLLRQPCLANSKNQLYLNGKTSFSIGTRHEEAEEILPSIPGHADFIVEKPDEEGPSMEVQAEEKKVNRREGNLSNSGRRRVLLDDTAGRIPYGSPTQAEYMVKEIREGSCNMHSGPRSVAKKAIRSEYYWPTMHKDARNIIRKCDDCQTYRPVPRNLRQKLTPITSLWPFYEWGIDISGPFSEEQGNVKFLIVAIDYFTKLSEEIISDNRKQFRDNPFKDWCEKLNIKQRFASVKHPQTNGQVERANRSVGEGIKARLGEENRSWVEEVPHVLWAHRTMIKTSNGDTPFSLTYGTEAVIPVEIGMPSIRCAEVNQAENDEELLLNLDILEERKEKTAVREARNKAKMEKYYNAKVRNISFHLRDFVYRSNEASHAKESRKLGPKWEGPHEVIEALGRGAYKLKNESGDVLSRTWNVQDLKKCYL
nr:reverse transcriptase domain-containing protein [Tanacetum cinerariifolium]